MYKQIKLLDGTIVSDQIKRVQDNTTIPFNIQNIDYQEYLKWLEAGNNPLPADE